MTIGTTGLLSVVISTSPQPLQRRVLLGSPGSTDGCLFLTLICCRWATSPAQGATGVTIRTWSTRPYHYHEEAPTILRCCWMGRYHMTNLTRGEQRMQMALWGIAPSPLFFGGDLTRMDAFTYSLLTNTDLLWLNNAATKSEEIRQNNSSGVRIWRAQRQGMALIGLPRQHNVTMYVAVFNTGSAPANEALSAADFGAQLDPDTNCGVVDVWTGMHIGSLQGSGLLKVNVSSHDVTVLRAECLQAL
jgi:hypothetical protein